MIIPSSIAATNTLLLFTMEGKSTRSFMASAVALEEVQLLCTVVSDTNTGTIILPQEPLPCICIGLEVVQTVSSSAY
jgi:hypothetical protein